MKPDLAAALLRPENSVDMASVKAAFAARCREMHPDTTPDATDRVAIGMLQEARNVLLNDIAQKNNACKLCRGVGKVRGAIGYRKCGACAGTGETK